MQLRFAVGWMVVVTGALVSVVGCTGAVGDGDFVADPRVTDAGEPTDAEPEETAPPKRDTGTADTRVGADAGSPPADTRPPPDTSPPIDASPPPPPDTGDPIADARVLCVNEINAYRATLSLAPYAGWTSAGGCADGQSKSDSATGTAHGAFGACGENAQNECPGWPGPPDTMIKGCLKSMWAEGPGSFYGGHGHYINMSSKSYTTVACGFYKTSSGSWWSVQDFR